MAIAALTTFTGGPGNTIYASQVNGNFSTIRDHYNANAVELGGSQTITGAKTFSAAMTTSAGITVNTTGLTIAPQSAITFSHASARIIPGATGLYFRDTANAADNVAITDAGAVTIRAGLTVTASGITITSGDLTVSSGDIVISSGGITATTLTADTFAGGAASSKILTGATNLLIRDSADSATLLTITNGGGITQGQNAAFSFGGGTVASVSSASASITLAAPSGFVYLGAAAAMSTSDTTGFSVVRTMAGPPTGSISTAGACVLDTTNNRIYFHNGSAWKYAALT